MVTPGLEFAAGFVLGIIATFAGSAVGVVAIAWFSEHQFHASQRPDEAATADLPPNRRPAA